MGEKVTSEIEVLREALRPFAEIADDREFEFTDASFPVHLGLMNGNVTQSVVRNRLHVSDFQRAKEALFSNAEKACRLPGFGLARLKDSNKDRAIKEDGNG